MRTNFDALDDDVSGPGKELVATALAVGAFEQRIGRRRLLLYSAAAGSIDAVLQTAFDTELIRLIGALASFGGLIGAGTALVTKLLYGRAWQSAVALGVIGLGWTLAWIVVRSLLPPSS